jgi:hypothetical protein
MAETKSKPKAKRAQYTVEERIAKAEADLAALKAKSAERGVSTLVKEYARKDKLQAQVEKIYVPLNETADKITKLEASLTADQVKQAKAEHKAEVEKAEAEAANAAAKAEAPHDANKGDK